MLIEHYDLKVYTPPCDPGAERFSACAELAVDISEVLPYLNATLRGAIYHRSANALTWKKSGHAIAFHATQIATSNVEDYDAAVKEIDGLVKLINRTWERRSEITPDLETHQRPPLLTRLVGMRSQSSMIQSIPVLPTASRMAASRYSRYLSVKGRCGSLGTP